MGEGDWVRVCRVDEVRQDEGKGVEVNGVKLGLYRLTDGCFALGDVCSHAYALLSTGFVEDDAVECPLHQARFEIRTGRSLDDIAPDNVPAYPVKVEDGDVWVRL